MSNSTVTLPNPAPEAWDCAEDACFTVRGTLVRFDLFNPLTGLLGLVLRGADDTDIEVLADAGSALNQLARVFGFTDRAFGQEIELSLDISGFAKIRAGS